MSKMNKGILYFVHSVSLFLSSASFFFLYLWVFWRINDFKLANSNSDWDWGYVSVKPGTSGFVLYPLAIFILTFIIMWLSALSVNQWLMDKGTPEDYKIHQLFNMRFIILTVALTLPILLLAFLFLLVSAISGPDKLFLSQALISTVFIPLAVIGYQVWQRQNFRYGRMTNVNIGFRIFEAVVLLVTIAVTSGALFYIFIV